MKNIIWKEISCENPVELVLINLKIGREWWQDNFGSISWIFKRSEPTTKIYSCKTVQEENSPVMGLGNWKEIDMTEAVPELESKKI